jgi:adenylate cyclase class 2
MGNEYETKVLDINVEEIQEKLKKLGIKKEKDIFLRRWVFDIGEKGEEWIRLRDEQDRVAITYKLKRGKGISDTEEIEVYVDDFDKTAEILSKLKFSGKYYQENKRELYKFKEMEISIDSWPKIPPYLEIEAPSEEKVHEGLRLLGLTGKDAGHPSVKDVYEKYGIRLHDYKELKFK